METKILNAFRQGAKRQCGSCLHKTVENDGTRVCQLMMLKVRCNFCCPRWQMDGGCEKAGLGLGHVKKKAYLLFVVAVRAEESEAIQKGIITEQGRRPIEQLREEFEREHGSIYAIL